MTIHNFRTGDKVTLEELRRKGLVRDGVGGKGRKPTHRHTRGEMNGTEKAFSEFAETHRQAGLILGWWFESITLHLAPGLSYTPDFLILELDMELTFIETKPSYKDTDGKVKVFARDGSIDKVKVAANTFPFIFKMAVRQPDKNWKLEEVK